MPDTEDYYEVGVQYSLNPAFMENTFLEFDYNHKEGAALDKETVFNLSYLMAGTTYYYRPFIRIGMETERYYYAKETSAFTTGAFTGEDIVPGQTVDYESGSVFRFIPENDGMYTFSTDGAEVYMMSAKQQIWDSGSVTFMATAGSTYYLFIHYGTGTGMLSG